MPLEWQPAVDDDSATTTKREANVVPAQHARLMALEDEEVILRLREFSKWMASALTRLRGAAASCARCDTDRTSPGESFSRPPLDPSHVVTAIDARPIVAEAASNEVGHSVAGSQAVVATLAPEPISTGTAREHVVVTSSPQTVGSPAREERVGAARSIEQVVEAIPDQDVTEARASDVLGPDDRVLALSTGNTGSQIHHDSLLSRRRREVEEITPATACVDRVVPGPRFDHVVSSSGEDRVVTATSADEIGGPVSGEQIASRSTKEIRLAARTSREDVVAPLPVGGSAALNNGRRVTAVAEKEVCGYASAACTAHLVVVDARASPTRDDHGPRVTDRHSGA
jgi:hypothetical protein